MTKPLIMSDGDGGWYAAMGVGSLVDELLPLRELHDPRAFRCNEPHPIVLYKCSLGVNHVSERHEALIQTSAGYRCCAAWTVPESERIARAVDDAMDFAAEEAHR